MTMQRILLSPEAVAEGTPPGDEMVSIAVTELEALRAAASAPAPQAGPDPAAEERLRASERRFGEELKRVSEKAKEWERACKAALKEKELAAALAGRPLVEGAAPQLIKLWREELEVIDEAGGLRISARDGRPVSEAVGAWLSSPEYAHFSRPGSRGGTAPPGNARSTSGAPTSTPPTTLGEATLLRWRESARASRNDPAAPIGLGRRLP